MPQSNMFTTEVRGQQHTFYITGPITEPENYVELCNTLRTSSPQDEVVVRINSRGGFVSSERMIVNAIKESQATVSAFIEYDCMSAATGIFLAAHQHGWADHIQFMAHCSWWGAVGKNPDIKSQTEFGLKQMEEEIEATYAGLLSIEEIIQCNEGKEFWFGAKELDTRMLNFYAYLEDQDSSEEDSEDGISSKQLEKTLEEVIKAMLEEVLEAKFPTQKVEKTTPAKKAPAKPKKLAE